ncbi:farnesol dehydrogenase-like isoform X1 [Teleopsis dalmanni]|uniref:farnesol dehydrogenase-like isoform X1 n=1 Tax=Teleopsis dalmanni TaxID=139649 RepID=UPI0018CEDBE7|nr:farnesol dehydrogenase-like isoform X1 [Teleopsis dalmanni]
MSQDSEYWHHNVAVVTGASVGIGASIAVALANAGMVVIGISRRTELIDELNKKVKGKGKIFSRHCDLTNEAAIVETFNWIREKFYVIHVLNQLRRKWKNYFN